MAALHLAATSVLLLLVAGLLMYTHPPQDEVSAIDAVFVLGPHTAPRLERAAELAAASGNAIVYVSVSRSDMDRPFCAEVRTICVTPEPFSTKGEALLLSTLHEENSFERVALVTVAPHAVRARYIFERCYTGRFGLVSVAASGSPIDLASQYIYQTAAFAKAVTTPCAADFER